MNVYSEVQKRSIQKVAKVVEGIKPEQFSPENQEIVIQILRAIDYKLTYMHFQAGLIPMR